MANMEKNLKNNETKKYKMTEREIFKKYDNLSENELNTKSNKDVYVRTDIIGSAIVHSTGEKGKKSKKNRWIQKKKIKDSRIWDFTVSRIHNQIKNRKNICKRKNTWRILC